MPADGVLDIDPACRQRSLRISLPADRTTIVAHVCHPAVCLVPGGPQTSPIVAAQVPMLAGGVR